MDMTVAFWGKNSIYEFRRVHGGSTARYFVHFISAAYLDWDCPRFG
jgi:hypothetical protein